MRIPNPDYRIWAQSNSGDTPVDANVVGSYNSDFSVQNGKVSPALRLKQVFNETDNADLGLIWSFIFFVEDYWGFGRRVWKSGVGGVSTWAQDVTSGSPSPSDSLSDAVEFDGGLVVSLSGSVSRLSTGPLTWTSNWESIGLTGTHMHPMEVVTIGSPVLCIGNGNVLTTVTGSGTYTVTASRLTLEIGQRIRWIRSGTSQVYIATTPTRTAGFGKIYIWDGGATNPTRSITLATRGAFTGLVHNDTLYIVTAEGELQRFDGAGFVTVAQFPIFNSNTSPLGYDSQQNNVGFMRQRGSCVRRGKLLFHIQGTPRGSSGHIEHHYGGIWEYDPAVGRLSHKYAVTYDKTGESDYGQIFVPEATRREPGALLALNDGNATLLASSGYFTGSSEEASAIYIDDIAQALPTASRVTTPQVFSRNIAGHFNTVALKYQPMNENDSITVKWRQTKKTPLMAIVAWTSSTTFTSTTDLSTVEEGEEVFVAQAKGAGDSAQVTDISESSGTYTVTLSRSIIGVANTDTGRVLFQNWKLLERFTDTRTSTRHITIPGVRGAWVQVLVELEGKGNSPVLEEIAVLEDKAE